MGPWVLKVAADEPVTPSGADGGVGMQWLTADFVRALSPMAVLLLVMLAIAYGWFRDRNARIRETNASARDRVAQAEREADRWRAAHEVSEAARERQAETVRQALEVGRTAVHAVEGLRMALDQANRDGDDR